MEQDMVRRQTQQGKWRFKKFASRLSMAPKLQDRVYRIRGDYGSDSAKQHYNMHAQLKDEFWDGKRKCEVECLHLALYAMTLGWFSPMM